MSFFGKSLGELAKRPTRYRVNEDGTISTLTPSQFGLNNRAYVRDCIWGSTLVAENSLRYCFPL